MAHMIIFTDLDGTLLDGSTYSFDAAADALKMIRERAIPLVLCSSKTRAEIEHYRSLLDNSDPFISENGGGIFIPRDYAPLQGTFDAKETEECDRYFLMRLGASYPDLRRALESLRAKGFKVKGFGDMTVDEVSHLTGLPPREAVMAKEREFDEPFTFDEEHDTLEGLNRSIAALGFNVTRGRFFHLLGMSDKGKAVSILTGLYTKAFGKLLTVGIGDSPNDLPMLHSVDMPAIVQKQDSSYDPAVDAPNLVRTPGIGPGGWNHFVKDLLTR